MYNEHMFGFGWGFMWLFWIFVVVAIIWLIKAFIGNSNNQEKKAKVRRRDFEGALCKGRN